MTSRAHIPTCLKRVWLAADRHRQPGQVRPPIRRGLELIGSYDKLSFEIIESASHTLFEVRSRERLAKPMDGFLARWAANTVAHGKAA